MAVIPIVLGALGTIPKGLVKGRKSLEIERKIGDHPDNCIIKIAKITKQSPDETYGPDKTYGHSNSSERPSANPDVKNCKGVNKNVVVIDICIFNYIYIYIYIYIYRFQVTTALTL